MDNMNYNFHDDYYYYDIVRKNIRKYRKMANLTQQQLADAIDVSMHYFFSGIKLTKWLNILCIFSKDSFLLNISVIDG